MKNAKNTKVLVSTAFRKRSIGYGGSFLRRKLVR